MVVELSPEVELVHPLPEVEVKDALWADRPLELAPDVARLVVNVETVQPNLLSVEVGEADRVLQQVVG